MATIVIIRVGRTWDLEQDVLIVWPQYETLWKYCAGEVSKPTSTCAAAAGLETGTELQRILRGFYPGLADDDSVTVIHFHVLQLGDFMHLSCQISI